eukprot:3074127-Amphidinium_carterae.1
MLSMFVRSASYVTDFRWYRSCPGPRQMELDTRLTAFPAVVRGLELVEERLTHREHRLGGHDKQREVDIQIRDPHLCAHDSEE